MSFWRQGSDCRALMIVVDEDQIRPATIEQRNLFCTGQVAPNRACKREKPEHPAQGMLHPPLHYRAFAEGLQIEPQQATPTIFKERKEVGKELLDASCLRFERIRRGEYRDNLFLKS
jgi:hypothetical protein